MPLLSRTYQLVERKCNRIPKRRSRSHDAVIGVYDAVGNMIETHEHAASSKTLRRTES